MMERQRRKVNPECPNAANPFHQCAEYCSTNSTSNTKKKQPSASSKPNEEGWQEVSDVGTEERKEEEEQQQQQPHRQQVNLDCPNAANPFHQCADYCHTSSTATAKSKANNKKGEDKFGDLGKEDRGEQQRRVHPDCPNATNAFHQCAEYCLTSTNNNNNKKQQSTITKAKLSNSTPPPIHSSTSEIEQEEKRPGGLVRDVGAEVEILEKEEEEERRGGLVRDVGAEVEIQEIEEEEEEEILGGLAQRLGAQVEIEEEKEERQQQQQPLAISKSKPTTPFHSATPAVLSAAAAAHNRTHSDGEQPRTPGGKGRTGRDGSRGLPLYVFLHDGSSGETKRVDPKCPNASNPFHMCTKHCITKMNEMNLSDGGKSPKSFFSLHSRNSSSEVQNGSSGKDRKVDPRCPNASNLYHECNDHCLTKIKETKLVDGGKSPKSFLSRNSRNSSSSEGENSVNSEGNKKVDPKCPNADNPFHECNEYCFNKSKETDRAKKRTTVQKAGKVGENWKVDPRCPHASNPYHICAPYCFDNLNEIEQAERSKQVARKGKTVLSMSDRGDVLPDCVNASNPYHKCGEYCLNTNDGS